jgi:hypothetical protein
MIKFALSFGCILLSIQIFAQTTVTVAPEMAINSAFQEYSPAFYENGLVFISSNPAVAKEKEADEITGKSTTSIFFARRGQDGKLQLPTPFAEALTSQYYDGPLTFSARSFFHAQQYSKWQTLSRKRWQSEVENLFRHQKKLSMDEY